MWTVVFSRSFVYYPYKVYRFETRYILIAWTVYVWWYHRYIMSVYPVKKIKMYRIDKDIPNLNSYKASSLGRRGKRDVSRKISE